MYYNKKSDTGVAGNVVTTLTSSDTQCKKLLHGHVKLTTDATVANRRVVVGLYDDSDAFVFDTHAGTVVAASASDQHHELMQGIFRETSFVGNALQVPIPEDFYVPPGYSIKISIENGVAGDSYDYHMSFSVEHVVPGETVID
jgi:hypothetical protein